ncbi:hypothetical protein CTRG_02823 [Candida tropicalis MYA-3404]|uniref:Major facilitator superfamily (MFS) profile domain-containing protein n=1 Tax=Candida tropicalis (strain ATCC MYA-3404 / T1) TaxID=294747 RepID=C5M8V1_CANTT|nr:hypothetical protein CTRG_02823 [Candida tropicalis MYA-3404]EER34005.1 hypothetical protein CTRG_02823 [Candida tropicalis MYA-3404]KAG4407860.1 hypothetical protein JTP64_003395 [Candida tropicalis]WGL47776.1 MFS antiporter qdr3 [Candida tropicalis]
MPNNTDSIPHRSDDEATSLASTDTQPNLDESQVHPVPHTEKSPEAQDQADHHETYRHTVEPNLGRLNELEDGLSSIESQHSGPQELSHSDGLAQNQHQSSLAASKSNATSMKSNRVPLKNRRGLFAQVVLIPEYHDARDYPIKIKYIIVFIIAVASLTGPFGTSVMLPAIDDIVSDLHTSVSTVNVSVGIYLLSLGIFPMWWSSFSERFGRRSVYMISFIMFVGFSIGTALSPSIAALIVLRVLQGGCSASVQAVGAGTIADLFIPQERGVAMGMYYLGPLMGPFLAPILGGAVAQAWGWRATQWLLMIIASCSLVSLTFLLPETLRRVDNIQFVKEAMEKEKLERNDDQESTVTNDSNRDQQADLERIATNLSRRSDARSILTFLEEQEDDVPVVDPVMPSISRLTTNRSTYSQRVQQDYVSGELHRSATNILDSTSIKQDKWAEFKTNAYDMVVRPLHSIILLKHPPVALVITFSAISFAAIYFFNMTISYEYSRDPYNFSEIIVGLMYIPNSVTYFLASLIGGRWNDRLLNKYAEKHGELVPESRISWNIVLAIILFPMACMIFGWTLKYGVFWLVPLVGTALFGFASMLVIGATVTYLVDTLPGKGATGVALNNLIRMILAAVATFIVEPLLRAIGPGILFSIITGILVVSSLVLVYLKKHGAYFREKYDVRELYAKL